MLNRIFYVLVARNSFVRLHTEFFSETYTKDFDKIWYLESTLIVVSRI
jgi:hypothetical protein